MLKVNQGKLDLGSPQFRKFLLVVLLTNKVGYFKLFCGDIRFTVITEPSSSILVDNFPETYSYCWARSVTC
ncbi:hypothetical protein P8452_70320 [Trifolium repens]|nr:hypothetical protein P8452_70320 [Trifolium repens]